ncbi:hypothetical protein, partial [Heyndrickxia coagulans]
VIFTNFYGKEYHLQKISYTTQQILHKKMAFFSGHEPSKRTIRPDFGSLFGLFLKPSKINLPIPVSTPPKPVSQRVHAHFYNVFRTGAA